MSGRCCVFTDGSGKIIDKSRGAYTVRVTGSIVAEKSHALIVTVTTWNMAMEVKAIAEALIFL